ncbi:RNA-directed DNA polymerase [Pelomonas sp. BJYL3]|uniref:RNA-directed DNA polymerase n=1 Tax=Pelomonas sp. BJYL3 TaxID=2976697 RepID=UPI0022B5BE69|nr:RNA-directed DNA polymerase [Pelomonas sp. BJYL3]
MRSFLSQVCDQLNIRWAWEKVKRASVPGDIWIDEADLASFEVHLGRELQSLCDDLRTGKFRMSPIRPMAFPKNPDGDGNPRVRQYFHFAVRDQVAWVAVVNVLGPYVDAQMPVWSYGNRLFRSAWIEEDIHNNKIRKVGPYRHSSGRIYRPFQQAWPLFRRHVALAVSAAAHGHEKVDNLDEDEREELDLQHRMHKADRCPFVFADYWTSLATDANRSDVYWASVDLEKFYPSIPLAACVDAISQSVPVELRPDVQRLLKTLTLLPLDLEGWTDTDLRHIELAESRKTFRRIPTGLMVSGFLANAALLQVDQEVQKSLPRGRVAHFRYVDDHVILAKTFEELVNWIDHYKDVIERMGSGASINPAKTEPKALGELLGTSDASNRVAGSDQWNRALDECRLDSEFPTPLMTKTIALVSAIGRTDFTVLEDNELSILSQQLEHLLLVEVPESEMPGRTRLAFAATRLARIAEARLAAPETLSIRNGSAQQSRLTGSQAKGRNGQDSTLDANASLTGINDAEIHARLAGIADRVFGLVRRVLHERPDRVRLWTHALTIARRLGATGLELLFDDIDRYARDPVNRLAASYILGNSYAVLAAETVRAAQLLIDTNAAGWRRAAALRSLRDIARLTNRGVPAADRWFVQKSLNQFFVGVYCATLLLERSPGSLRLLGQGLSRSFVDKGRALLSNDDVTPDQRVALAWWGCKFDLRKPIRRASDLILHLGTLVNGLPESDDLWTFFPADAPMAPLARIASSARPKQANQEGWWLDALMGRFDRPEVQRVCALSPAASRVQKALDGSETAKLLPLPVWATRIWASHDPGITKQWRLGEWTCLEIVRQAAMLLSTTAETLDQGYLKRASRKNPDIRVSCAHPLNFALPSHLIDTPAVSWQEWKQKMREPDGGVLRQVPQRRQIYDRRYAPLVVSAIGAAQNPIRGLGLCLFALLSRSFLLPAQWNGIGHESMLRHLPQLLRNEITYSSATLGILEACLQPRATENVFAGLHPAWSADFDDDTMHDPVSLIDAADLARIISIAQNELEENQISTFNHQSRQVTPVNLMHLTDADWKRYFEMGPA